MYHRLFPPIEKPSANKIKPQSQAVNALIVPQVAVDGWINKLLLQLLTYTKRYETSKRACSFLRVAQLIKSTSNSLVKPPGRRLAVFGRLLCVV